MLAVPLFAGPRRCGDWQHGDSCPARGPARRWLEVRCSCTESQLLSGCWGGDQAWLLLLELCGVKLSVSMFFELKMQA